MFLNTDKNYQAGRTAGFSDSDGEKDYESDAEIKGRGVTTFFDTDYPEFGGGYRDQLEAKKIENDALPNWIWGAWAVVGVAGAGLLAAGLCGHFDVGALSNMGDIAYLPIGVGAGLMLMSGGVGVYKIANHFFNGEKEVQLKTTTFIEIDPRLEFNRQLKNSDLKLEDGEYTVVPLGNGHYRIFYKDPSSEHVKSYTADDADLDNIINHLKETFAGCKPVKFYSATDGKIYFAHYLNTDRRLNTLIGAGQYSVVPGWGKAKDNYSVFARDDEGTVFEVARGINGTQLRDLAVALDSEYDIYTLPDYGKEPLATERVTDNSGLQANQYVVIPLENNRYAIDVKIGADAAKRLTTVHGEEALEEQMAFLDEKYTRVKYFYTPNGEVRMCEFADHYKERVNADKYIVVQGWAQGQYSLIARDEDECPFFVAMNIKKAEISKYEDMLQDDGYERQS